MRKPIYILLVLLVLLHQDFWYWNDPSLLFGFLPIGLAYHAAFSIVSAVVWGLIMAYAWPEHIDEFANETSEHPD